MYICICAHPHFEKLKRKMLSHRKTQILFFSISFPFPFFPRAMVMKKKYQKYKTCYDFILRIITDPESPHRRFPHEEVFKKLFYLRNFLGLLFFIVILFLMLTPSFLSASLKTRAPSTSRTTGLLRDTLSGTTSG